LSGFTIPYSPIGAFATVRPMDSKLVIDGLLLYLGLLVLLTFHEFGHAWMAWKCGDDTLSRFLVGWAKPVPVNPHNLRNPRLDDILVTLAGPWMNLLLAIVIMALARMGLVLNSAGMVELCENTARLSLMLCFFNLLPIPPLDGSHVARILMGMTYETYYKIARYGFIILIIVLQIPFIRNTLSDVTSGAFNIIAGWFGVPL
jgi:Zn-dependent protease